MPPTRYTINLNKQLFQQLPYPASDDESPLPHFPSPSPPPRSPSRAPQRLNAPNTAETTITPPTTLPPVTQSRIGAVVLLIRAPRPISRFRLSDLHPGANDAPTSPSPSHTSSHTLSQPYPSTTMSPAAADSARWTRLSQQLDLALGATATDDDRAGAAYMAVALSEVQDLQDKANKIKSAAVTDAATVTLWLTELRAYAQGRADSLVTMGSGLASTGAAEPADKEFAAYSRTILSQTFPEGCTETDVILWLKAFLNNVPKRLRQVVDPVDPEKMLVRPKELLETLCTVNGHRLLSWWESTGAHKTWEELQSMASFSLTSVSRMTDQSVYEEFEALAKSFDWMKQYRSKDNVPLPPSAEYAVQLAKVFQRAPAFLQGEGAQWMYTVAARRYLPDWCYRQVAGVAGDRLMTLLTAIKEISSETWLREKEAEAALLRMINAGRQAASRGQSTPAQPSAQKYEPPQLRQAKQESSDLPPKKKTHFTGWATKGSADYEKAMASFEKSNPDPAATPFTARFPLSPGSHALNGEGCDKCGKPDHRANSCHGPPVYPRSEIQYRRVWRIVTAAKRGKGPEFLNRPGQFVHMMADTTNWLMEENDGDFYGETEQGNGNGSD
ncbi:hypothetical protein JCM10213_004058 [Rhodosporidiobolus nylandii]